MGVITFLLRCFAFLFNFGFSAALLALALLAIYGGQHNIQLQATPWQGEALTRNLLLTSIAGLAASALALATGRLARSPMLAWNLFVPGLLMWMLLRPAFSFDSPEQAVTGLCLLLASLAALWGSWLHWRQRRRSGPVSQRARRAGSTR